MQRIFLCLTLIITPVYADNNQAMKACLAAGGYDSKDIDTFDFNKAAACHSDYRVGVTKAKNAELRDFLDANPRYRVPGQSLNKCWGKRRETPFESAGLEVSETGMKAWVNYKDKLPAGCYENGPWDNRDED